MKRLVPLLGAVLTLALSGTAAADTFVVVRPSGSDGAGYSAFGPTAGTIEFTAAPATPQTQTGPMSFASLRSIWEAAGSAYGIPWEVLAAINKVETNFGSNLGPSSAGAVGWMQFMPSTWARWGVDANGDGVADPNNPTDAIFSAARYLAACGGQTDISRAVYCYNHAYWYVNDVLGLAAQYSRAGSSGLVSLDQLQAQLDAAQTQVATSKKQVVAARADARRLGRAERRFLHLAATARLVSDQLEARKHAVLLGVRRDAALARVSRLNTLLETATTQLGNVQQQRVALAPMGTGSAGLVFGRIDQGVDITSSSPFPAMAAGKVVYIDPNFWQGTPAVYEKLDQPVTIGGNTYDEIFYSETQALVHVGQRLSPGEPVIAAGSAEIGFARGHLPAAHATYHEGAATQAGNDFYMYITAGSPAGWSTPSDPLFFMLGGPTESFQTGSGATTAFPTIHTASPKPKVVYFTH
jgi:hypothetical protein